MGVTTVVWIMMLVLTKADGSREEEKMKEQCRVGDQYSREAEQNWFKKEERKKNIRCGERAQTEREKERRSRAWRRRKKKKGKRSESECVCTWATEVEKEKRRSDEDPDRDTMKKKRTRSRARFGSVGQAVRRAVVGAAAVAWMTSIVGVRGDGRGYGPELVIRRSDEEALRVLATVVLATGKRVMDVTGNLVQRRPGWQGKRMDQD